MDLARKSSSEGGVQLSKSCRKKRLHGPGHQQHRLLRRALPPLLAPPQHACPRGRTPQRNHRRLRRQERCDDNRFPHLVRERPPRPSNVYVHSSGATFGEPPELLAMADHVILVHVYTGPPHGVPLPLTSDFFMYRVDPRLPSLTLLPHPQGLVSKDSAFGIFPRGEEHYTIAALRPPRYSGTLFKLSLYESETNIWEKISSDTST